MARWVKLASICPQSLRGAGISKEKLIEDAERYIGRAALDAPDLIVLPELCLTPSTAEKTDAAESVNGPTIKAIAANAKKYRTYIFAPLLERRGAKCYNSLVLIDRKGRVVGAYRKNHPVICEIRNGISPGTKMPVFKTDFGRVGACICYDMNFSDVPERLHKNGAELVIFSSAWRAGLILQARALLYNFWILSSYPGEMGMLVDPLGRVVRRSWAGTPLSQHNLILSCRVNIDCILLHCDYNELMLHRIKNKYGSDVEIDAEEVERRFLLTSHHPKISALDIKREFKLESLDEFWLRADRWRKWALANLPKKSPGQSGKTPPALPKGWREKDLP